MTSVRVVCDQCDVSYLGGLDQPLGDFLRLVSFDHRHLPRANALDVFFDAVAGGAGGAGGVGPPAYLEQSLIIHR